MLERGGKQRLNSLLLIGTHLYSTRRAGGDGPRRHKRGVLIFSHLRRASVFIVVSDTGLRKRNVYGACSGAARTSITAEVSLSDRPQQVRHLEFAGRRELL